MVCPLTRVRTLERKLEAKMLKEESDYHDLESVVQQAEQNLELMTVRRAGRARRGQVSGCVTTVAPSPTWWAQCEMGPSQWLSPWEGPPAGRSWPEANRRRGQGGQDEGDVACVHATMSMMPFPRLQKRAVKAENHVMKLKQEMSLLQVIRPQVFT